MRKGQISFFLAFFFLAFLTGTVMLINLGLLIKAKINLQNAVDAAAYSGASVQARHLTKIAWLNFELRNTYKEWMFRYYVIGSLNTISGKKDDLENNSSMNFKVASSLSSPMKDQFNFPSICLFYSNNNSGNICSIYSSSGLPKYSDLPIPGAGDTLKNFYNSLYSLASYSCTKQSRLNYLSALLWSYHVPSVEDDPVLFEELPHIQTDQLGAFPQAIDLSFRIRNLEYMVNESPRINGICKNPSSVDFCSESIDNYQGSADQSHERFVKAYYSAYRNLGNDWDQLIKESFTLKELSPKEFQEASLKNLSNLLLPTDKRTKYYLDLKLYLMNLSVFYSSFVSSDQSNNAAQCDVTKTALPVPGYPMGFFKNPNVITYYAVSGEALFKGLFHPFKKPLKLVAYSSAKPFGGRIGPQLFKDEGDYVVPRNDNFRSYNFGVGLDLYTVKNPYNLNQIYSSTNYMPGLPIPFNDSFFISKPVESLGGWTTPSKFFIPNMNYDFIDNSKYVNANMPFFIAHPGEEEEFKGGLFNSSQFKKLKNILDLSNNTLTEQSIRDSLLIVRQPTLWDALNYLIPTSNELNKNLQIESFGLPLVDKNSMILNAPLYGTKLYPSKEVLLNSLSEYIQSQTPAIEEYVNSLKLVSQSILNSAAGNDVNNYVDASKGLYDGGLKPTCKSMAGNFLYFYTGDENYLQNALNCPLSLKERLNKFWDLDNKSFSRKNYHMINYKQENLSLSKKYFSAFFPTKNQGTDSEGNFVHPILGSVENTLKNFYSVKFISTNSLIISGKAYTESSSDVEIYSEGKLYENTKQNFFLNPLKENNFKKSSIF